MNRGCIKEITAWSEVDGNGQKVVAAVLTYKDEMNSAAIKEEDFEVRERRITAAYVSDVEEPGHPSGQGVYVILELDKKDRNASTIEMIGRGRDARMHIKEAEIFVRQKNSFQTVSGEIAPETDFCPNDKSYDPIVDKFQRFCFDVPGTDKKLEYNLFTPERTNEADEKYPLVLFMHDLGSCSEDTISGLAQGNGGVIWASEEEQKKHPCFVLVPHYPDKTAEDDYTVTWEADATVALIKSLLTKYNIDAGRIYGTGQSMGCMMLCELNIRYPDFFAASFLVAGQWEPQRMVGAKNSNLWALVSEGDFKAFPIMGDCMKAMEAAGEKVSRGGIDAKAPLEEQNRILQELAEEGNHLLFTWYTGKSILPEDMEDFPGAYHVGTWKKAYTLDAVHDWMFRQQIAL